MSADTYAAFLVFDMTVSGRIANFYQAATPASLLRKMEFDLKNGVDALISHHWEWVNLAAEDLVDYLEGEEGSRETWEAEWSSDEARLLFGRLLKAKIGALENQEDASVSILGQWSDFLDALNNCWEADDYLSVVAEGTLPKFLQEWLEGRRGGIVWSREGLSLEDGREISALVRLTAAPGWELNRTTRSMVIVLVEQFAERETTL